MQFISDYRYEITMAVGIGFCLVLYLVVRSIFGPDPKKAKAAKKKAGKNKGGEAGSSTGSSLDDEEDEFKDANLFGEDGDKEDGAFKDWD